MVKVRAAKICFFLCLLAALFLPYYCLMNQDLSTDHQTRIIEQYYLHLDTIMLDKLSELVSELYLADTASRSSRLWSRVEKAMAALKVPPAIIKHIMGRRDVEILAKNLEDWLSNADRKKKYNKK